MAKFISLNIEHSKHLDTAPAFLQKEQADIVCLQELDEPTIPLFEAAVGGRCFFVPMSKRGDMRRGIGIFTRHTMLSKNAYRYGGSKDADTVPDGTTFQTRYDTTCYSLALCDIKIEGVAYRIGTTHFPVTEHGTATDFQRNAMTNLLSILESKGELLLCGDFNAPRGGEIFAMLADKYRDNIPSQYKTSLDLKLHRAVQANQAHEIADKMVDGLFSTPKYAVSEVRLQDGVSDHCAIVASVTLL
jgi:endonuclease/exonuclease/phosphatase family metal-dependent hydrolase